MKKLFAYIRLSDADGDLKYKSESDSIANQRALISQYIKTHSDLQGYSVVEFVDDGYTGTNDLRPSFERMIEELKSGASKLVLCKDFSRFFRDYVETGDYLERIFPFLGVRFISINDGYDSDNYKGTTAGMDVVMKYIVYHYYSRDLSQKIKTVMRSRAKRGEFCGSFAPYGFLKDPDNKNHLVLDPDSSRVVRKIFELAMEGKKIPEIARILNEEGIETPAARFKRLHPESNRFKNTSKMSMWDTSNVRRILEEQMYTGALISGKREWKGIDHPQTLLKDKKDWIIVPNCHEAIVTQEEFEKANSIIRRLPKFERGVKDYLLRSLVRCGVCGRAMQRNANAKVVTYQCHKSAFKDKTGCPTGEYFGEKELEQAVKNSLTDMLHLLVDSDKRIRTASRKTEGTADHLRQKILTIEKSLKQNKLARLNAYEKYSDGDMTKDAFSALREKLAKEEEKLAGELGQAEKSLSELEATFDTELHALAEEARDVLKASEMTNRMLLHFIDRVYVYSGMRIDIRYRFSDRIAAILEEEAKTAETR